MTRQQILINKHPSIPGLMSRWLIASLTLVLALTCVSTKAQDFDHDSTLFPLDLTHQRVGCDTCHVQRIFKGTPTLCVGCHARSSLVQASAPSPNHIPVVEDCGFCHQGPVWESVYRVDHFAVIGSCQSCHNGVIAEGKHNGHVQSSDTCDNCHRSNGWLNAVFDHSDIGANCQNCHNGIIATGKSANHIISRDSCDDCHRTISWTPIIRVDHAAVIGVCSNCHNNIIAEGKAPDHQATNDECNACHLTSTWLGATSNRAAFGGVSHPNR